MKLMESRLPQAYSRALLEEKSLDLAASHMNLIMDVIFTATANILHNVKSIEAPVAYTFKKLDGSFVAGAVVKYFPNEDTSNPGNWSLVWTFDEENIPSDAKKLDINADLQSHSYFRAVAGGKYGIRFETQSDIIDLTVTALAQLKKWLDENAKEGTTVTIEQDGVFQARVSVENGNKIFAIEPDGEIKTLIKDDAAIEK